MNEEEIRRKIRERLKSGSLPRELPSGARLQLGAVVESFLKLGLDTKYPCSACDGDGPTMTYVYSDREVRFHERCENMWEDERNKLVN